jgi:hypothetical protein
MVVLLQGDVEQVDLLVQFQAEEVRVVLVGNLVVLVEAVAVTSALAVVEE